MVCQVRLQFGNSVGYIHGYLGEPSIPAVDDSVSARALVGTRWRRIAVVCHCHFTSATYPRNK